MFHKEEKSAIIKIILFFFFLDLVYLEKNKEANFGKFFAILTHEMGHVFGKDGEREFSDVLTHIIAQAVEKNSVISKYSKSWARYRA